MSDQSLRNSVPVALTIGGLDPSGGAGILADVRTFAAFGCFPTAVLTSVTFQNTSGVFGARHQSAADVREQALPILQDFRVAGVKTGMLPTAEIIIEVARLLRASGLPQPVIDPVMQATSGDKLIDEDAVNSLISELFPLARVVTPNIPEAERLTGRSIRNEVEMAEAARMIRALGARAVLLKGGHLVAQVAAGRQQEAAGGTPQAETRAAVSGEAIDVLDDEGRVTVFREELVSRGEVHGSGCTLSAAMAACLGKGMDLEDSVRAAKRFVTNLIRHSPRIGHGARPLYIPPDS